MSHGLWGKDAPRRFFDDRHWQEPVHWNRQAEKSGVRRKVFCASMADVFEDRRDLDALRFRLFHLIEQTPWLDWLLLTKRTDRIAELVPVEWLLIGPPSNAWFGTTVENQRMAEIRLPALRALPFVNPMPWVSYEPALGPVNWQPWLDFIRWIIFGGESGSDRESCAEWALNTMEQCRRRGLLDDGRPAVALFNKQAGEFMARQWHLTDKAGKDPSEWPEWFRVQQFPDPIGSVMDEQCPGCDVVITPTNAGGYRTFCERCVDVFPPLPAVGGFVIEGRFPSFVWVPVEEGGTRAVPVFPVDESIPF